MEFRRAEIADIPAIMAFIDEHWKKDHILAKDRKFFEWQYVDEDQNGKANFFIAIEHGNIMGINGFIRYNWREMPDMAGSIWKVLKTDNPVLGLELAEAGFEMIPRRYFCAPGLNRRSCRIERLSHNPLDELRQYYRLNDLDEYKIAKVVKKEILKADRSDLIDFAKVECIDDFYTLLQSIPLEQYIPYKDENYYSKRFWKHPIYKYEMFSLRKGEKTGIVVGREVQVGNAKMMKIVDYIGDTSLIAYLSQHLDKLMEERGYEFIDFYCYGIEDEILTKGGFAQRTEEDQNILPNYFEPYVQENIPIFFTANEHQMLTNPNFHMYRADGDQDRPSIARS